MRDRERLGGLFKRQPVGHEPRQPLAASAYAFEAMGIAVRLDTITTHVLGGESVTGGVVHVVVSLTGATIVSATTTNIRPDQGHIHLYVDNNLVSMNYGTQQDLPIAPGTHILHVEFVASDHVPFNPRVISPDVVFTVKP